ncbi:PZF1, partial [Candida africana]
MSESDETKSISSLISSSSSSRPKKYICTYEGCDKAYNRPSLLEQHLRTHSNDRPYKCTVEDCDKAFFRKSHLETHIVSHSEKKPFHCSVCGKGVNSRQHLKRHEITHTKSFKCTFENCQEAFYKHQSLRHHILSVHEKTLTCKQCNKVFTRPSKLAQHKLKHHGGSPAYQCDHPGCFKNFQTWSVLQFHIKQLHPKLKCPKCGKGCVGKKGLSSHMLSHDDSTMIKIWTCDYCDVGKFAKKNELVEHYNIFHDGNIPDDLLKETEVKKLENLLDQGSKLNNLHELETEKLKVEEDEEDEEDSLDEKRSDVRSDSMSAQRSIKSFTASLEGSKSVSKLILNSGKKINCPKNNCDRMFSREYDLRRHLKWHDDNLQRIESFLNSIEKEETPEGEPLVKKARMDLLPNETSVISR